MRLSGYAVLGLVLTGLCGCAGFKERFKPEDAAWAGQKGDKTIAIRLYGTNGQEQWRCDNYVKNARLMPDTVYYRDWMRIMASAYNFRSSPSKKAKAFIRTSPRISGCMFVFKEVPAGNWIFLGDLDHAISPYWVTRYTETGSYRTLITSSGHDFVWGVLQVSPSQVQVYKDVVEDARKRHDVGMFKFHHFGASADVKDWEPSAEEKMQMELGAFVNLVEGARR